MSDYNRKTSISDSVEKKKEIRYIVKNNDGCLMWMHFHMQ